MSLEKRLKELEEERKERLNVKCEDLLIMQEQKKTNKNEKIVVAPTYEIALYWTKQMKMNKICKIITYKTQLHGLRPTKEHTIFIEGEEFDYPERKVRQTTWKQYEEIRYRVQELINKHELNKTYTKKMSKKTTNEKIKKIKNMIKGKQSTQEIAKAIYKLQCETKTWEECKKILELGRLFDKYKSNDYESQPNFIVAAGVLVGIAIAIGTIIALSYAYFK